jgi:hypothetical protein
MFIILLNINIPEYREIVNTFLRIVLNSRNAFDYRIECFSVEQDNQFLTTLVLGTHACLLYECVSIISLECSKECAPMPESGDLPRLIRELKARS